ncbi:translocation/assembly module TamB domain-containing protein [Jannaschia sp. KMU-145]|uniref:translocation/assembly module TamB domain-containing protein n=1 Tax=Jannaschia halovivens TaxID=3388667 RepID=UPI00396B0942
MRRLALALACAATPVLAQDETERDRGFLTALIEDNLSAPGLAVRIDGFDGALSSEATMDRLSISDDEGTWLVLEDVVLDWNRSALLRGRLEVTQLTAGLIRVDRAPLPAEGVEALPDAGASGFSLPDLPVAVEIDTLTAERIELGAPFLGEEVALTLDASASLVDGSLDARIEAQRLDGATGQFSIALAYASESQDLTVDIDLTEGEGGIAATLLQLPGRPAIELTVAGSGPLDAFTADIAVASDGVERIGGDVTLTGTPDGRRFEVDLGGDVTALFAPRYRPFFGDDVRIAAAGLQRNAGGTDLDTMRIATQAFDLSGNAQLGPDGWPTLLDIEARIAATDGGPVVLPIGGDPSLAEARLAITHDATVSDNWRLDLDATRYEGPDVTVATARITADGILSRANGAVERATAAVTAALDGLVFADPALGQAVGPRVALDGDVAWSAGSPVRISGLELAGGAYALGGTVEIATAADGLPITMDVTLRHDRLQSLAALAGQDLAGTARATIRGVYAPLAGTFDLNLDAETQDLGLGIAQADAVLAGGTTLTAAARRTVDGTFLDAFRVGNDRLTAQGAARLLDTDAPETLQGQRSTATFSARLDDGTILDPRLDGPIQFAVDVTRDDEGAWRGNFDAAAPNGVAVSANGVLTGDTPAVDFTANVPDLSAFADGVPGAVSLAGTASAANGLWSLDAEASGPWGLRATVEGPVTGPTPEITFEATLPDLTDPVPALASIEALRGAVDLSGTIGRTGDAWRLDTRLDAPAGITLRARGPVTGDAPRIEFVGTVPETSDLVPAVEGRLDLDGAVFRADEDWVVDATATGPYGATVTARSALTAQPLAVDFTADIPDLGRVAPAIPGSLSVSGQAVQRPDGFAIEFEGTGPYDATLDIGVDLAGAPVVTATGQIPDAARVSPQLRGPLDYDLRAEQTEAGWRVDAAVNGAQGLAATVEGLATGPSADLSFTARAANVSPFLPGLSGPLDASGRLFQQGGEWAVDLDASGPLGARLSADGTLTGGAASARFDLSVPDISPLVPDLAGPLRIDGTANQQGDGWRLDVDATGPAGTQAAIDGTVASGGTLDLSVQGSAPLGLANAAIAPRRLAGQARFDLNVNGPPALDSVRGTIQTSDAALSLPTLRNTIENIDATVTLTGARAQVELTAAPASGGRIEVSGPVDLTPPFNANLTVGLDVTLTDPNLYTADLSGQITVTGPLTAGPLIAGRIEVDGAEIAVPSTGLTAVGDLPPIRHLATPRPVQRTLARAGQDAASVREALASAERPSGPPVRLDLVISAPGRIFVRGRGLDAELGGQLQLRGTANAPITTGGFELVRGRLDVLQQRFELDEGAITFQGDLVPNIRLVAVTETDTITASIIVEGPADNISVRFESTPDVPQEEILAQIFFGRDLSQLSPLQALQLANSVAVLAGRSQGGLLDRLRGDAGLDDLDITADDEGNVALRAGKYLSDNVYTDVQIDQNGEASISLNLDLTPNLTVRGAAGATGDTSLGVFFEKDY